MGWADCGEDSLGRPIGYSYEDVPCDFEGCEEKIDRGLGYACGGMHGDDEGIHGEPCCERYYCGEHLDHEDHACPALPWFNVWEAKRDLADSRELLGADDEEMRDLARAEIPALERQLAEAESLLALAIKAERDEILGRVDTLLQEKDPDYRGDA
jgi:hypothetical protein